MTQPKDLSKNYSGGGVTRQYATITDMLCEGPILGLSTGDGASVYFDNTQLIEGSDTPALNTSVVTTASSANTNAFVGANHCTFLSYDSSSNTSKFVFHVNNPAFKAPTGAHGRSTLDSLKTKFLGKELVIENWRSTGIVEAIGFDTNTSEETAGTEDFIFLQQVSTASADFLNGPPLNDSSWSAHEGLLHLKRIKVTEQGLSLIHI